MAATLTRYRFEVDLIGSTTTEEWDAPSETAARALVALIHPEARSMTLVAATPVNVKV